MIVPGVSASESEAPEPRSMVVRKTLGVQPRTRNIYYFPKMAPRTELRVYNSDLVTAVKAIKERVFFVKNDGEFIRPPTPKNDIFVRKLRAFTANIRAHLPSTTPITREAFAALYTGRRRKLYESAAASLVMEPFRSKDAKIKSFVKAEKGKPGAVPRIIQPRGPRYNVELGRYLKPIEERVFKAIGKVWGERVVMKGITQTQIAAYAMCKWQKYRDPVAIGLDASRFDQHVSKLALLWEHMIYLLMFKSSYDRKELRRLLALQIENKCTAVTKDGRVSYVTDGCRMSGDMNTSLGNCLLMCAMLWAYKTSRGVRCSLMNNGDDCVVIMERRDAERFSVGLSEWFTDMGFTMTIEPTVDIFEKIVFCQSQPVFDGVRYSMVRGLLAFEKDAIALTRIDHPNVFKMWMNAVGRGGLSLTGGYPIWQEFYDVFRRSACAIIPPKRRNRGKKTSEFLNQAEFQHGILLAAKGMDRCYRKVTDQARYSFWLAFGIIPDHQIALEHEYRKRCVIPFNQLPSEDYLPMDGW